MKNIDCIILDVDGTLTDGKISYTNNGDEIKSFHVQDGMGIVLRLKQGFNIIAITGRSSSIVEKRCKELGIQHMYQGIKNKKKKLQDLTKKYGWKLENMCYIGDDLNNLPAMSLIGYPIAVANASPDLKKYVSTVSTKIGGKGAIREIIELILQKKGLRDDIIKDFTQ